MSNGSPASFKGVEVLLTLMAEAKAFELFTRHGGGLPSKLAKACTVEPCSALLQLLSMDRILLPPRRISDVASVA